MARLFAHYIDNVRRTVQVTIDQSP
jgi:hypothetical protein